MTNTHWHYQLMRHTNDDGEPFFAIHEYYISDDGSDALGWTESPVFVDGESVEEVKRVLQMMLEDIEAHGVKDYE